MAYCILNSYKLKVAPLEIFEALKDKEGCFFLDSSLNSNYSLGRYSFLGMEPFKLLAGNGADALVQLRRLLEIYKIPPQKNAPPFLGGAIGYLSYDLGFTLEQKVKPGPKPRTGIEGCLFAFYNTVIIIDHGQRRVFIFSCGLPEKKYSAEKLLAERNFKRAYKLLTQAAVLSDCFVGLRPPRNEDIKDRGKITSNFTKEGYILAVKRAKQYIRAGDIYQVNLSQEFKARSYLGAADIYKRLRFLSPSYFSAYFDAGDFQFISSSPERFLKLENETVTTRPMKGTRLRPENNPARKKMKEELIRSAKDKAELMMIVDLERNDLGRVCSYDSVRVPRIRQLEQYSSVFQTTATVCGRLHKDKDRVDLLRACFPGGSITGCPKIRAMEIIEELEPHRRGIYTGALGYLSFSGGMDFNIMIRTILKRKNQLSFGAGGGIVADSNPDDEYEETLVKAGAMMRAIG